jgi:16S rRNA (guanine527-N7)-methyltransferase
LNLKELLKDGAAELGVELNDEAIRLLWVFKDFLKEYNKKVNLTAIRDDEGIVVKHFLDCLTVLPHLDCGAVIDIGTGPGFPGIIIKIVRPELKLTLVDARAKKVKFLEAAAALLGLEIECIHARAEDLGARFAQFDYAVSRAVAQMDILAGWCLPFVAPGGKFIAMKGPNFMEELAGARTAIKRAGGKVAEIIELTLPNSDIARSLIIIRKNVS